MVFLIVYKKYFNSLVVESVNEATKLVGIGTDGVAANVARHGLKGRVEEKCP